MKVLVFGARGQIGRALASYGNVQALDRAAVDLRDPQACAKAILNARPDAVINAAAMTDITLAEATPDDALRINAHAPGAMAQAAADLDVPFLHLSSDYVFDGTIGHAWPPDAAPAPLNAYGRSKLEGEIAVRAAGGSHAILRTSWVFAPEGRNFLNTMLGLGKTRRRIEVVGDQLGGPTPARDVAKALIRMAIALRGSPEKWGTYHFCGAPAVSWAEFARAIFRRAGLRAEVDDISSSALPGSVRRPANSTLDCTSAFWQFGLVQPDWRAALDEILRQPAAA